MLRRSEPLCAPRTYHDLHIEYRQCSRVPCSQGLMPRGKYLACLVARPLGGGTNGVTCDSLLWPVHPTRATGSCPLEAYHNSSRSGIGDTRCVSKHDVLSLLLRGASLVTGPPGAGSDGVGLWCRENPRHWWCCGGVRSAPRGSAAGPRGGGSDGDAFATDRPFRALNS